MAAAIPYAIKAAPLAISAISGLLGKKKSSATPQVAAYTPNPAYTKPLAGFAESLLPMAQTGFQTAFNYYQPLAQGDQQALATATASDAASLGRQQQQLTSRAGRSMQRGGAAAALMGALPQQQMAAALGNRIAAQQSAVQGLTGLSQAAGGMGGNIFGGLLGQELGGYQASTRAGTEQGYLDLARTRENRDWYGRIGGGIVDVFTGKLPGSSGSILDILMGKGRGGGGVSVPSAPSSLGNIPISSLPNYSDWSKILGR